MAEKQGQVFKISNYCKPKLCPLVLFPFILKIDYFKCRLYSEP